ncbi:unknown [Spodoptera litura nucleopolyhedrovirus]|uniref:Uncharacterized protein n=1 Tax=Spodoptera litura multicapsid nucleopolyhedrovirus TaxID=46242 RepID=Q9DJ44_NPVST|nr:hypothetical protein [Spodoptera litura nucleopolyhedrovirus]WML75175.1 hypothetical protein KBIHDJOI_00002 [Spodoptera littoralis nucleopolyhedrovirus]AAG22850.1 unknown [Spodoptera litura nucleopolyhedrovirus]AAL01794.1 unknown [Spodoptera litura nucleopolyhedrovirus]QHN73961.1 hypothetical protein [Spodoptera litura nucleopolyhedrovirus]UQV25647.1 hypothetical protein [Spodoptera litura nucleopolyhedrovirus]
MSPRYSKRPTVSMSNRINGLNVDKVPVLLSILRNAVEKLSHQSFRNHCFRLITLWWNRNTSSVSTLRQLFDGLIEMEYVVFKKSCVLNFLICFLVNKHEAAAENPVYVQCLDYLLWKHDSLTGDRLD